MNLLSNARAGIAAIITSLAIAAPAAAQTTSPSTTTTGTGISTTSAERRDDGFNWGWLGLLGLAGLAGLRRRDDVTDINRTRPTGAVR